jgi:transcriptional regulator with XRE-family HTH domain
VTVNGAAIKALREAHGWTLRTLARRAQISHTYLAQIEANERRPSREVIDQLAQALAAPAEAITREDAMSSPPDLDLKLYTAAELGELWSVSPDWLQRRAAAGEIDATYVGFGSKKLLRFTADQARAAMEGWKVPAVNQPKKRAAA